MLLQKEDADVKVIIKAYKPGCISLNIGEFKQSILLINGEKKEFNAAENFERLSFEHLTEYLKDKPEILIIGTGEKHQMLSPAMTQKINNLGIAVEAMASRQACHTYQVLAYEQRTVHALIFA